MHVSISPSSASPVGRTRPLSLPAPVTYMFPCTMYVHAPHIRKRTCPPSTTVPAFHTHQLRTSIEYRKVHSHLRKKSLSQNELNIDQHQHEQLNRKAETGPITSAIGFAPNGGLSLLALEGVGQGHGLAPCLNALARLGFMVIRLFPDNIWLKGSVLCILDTTMLYFMLGDQEFDGYSACYCVILIVLLIAAMYYSPYCCS